MKTVAMVVACMLGLMFLTGCMGKKSTSADATAKAMPQASSAESSMATVDGDDSNGNNNEEIRAMAPSASGVSAVNQVRLPSEPVAEKPGKSETFHAQQLSGNWRNKVQIEAEIEPSMLEF